ncbi:unnamed protein product [Macrosiphum euphorbiae]|uniref:Uncharacterized protein n=1 Tax=Macrosiphum euphorbiae TaxID=13131 RepID=A0AAV0WJN7_9HEMI|nr:unnamed protein product [Macrosiphum euphorbiae]
MADDEVSSMGAPPTSVFFFDANLCFSRVLRRLRKQTGGNRPQEGRSAQAYGRGVQGQESQEGFHDPGQKEETPSCCLRKRGPPKIEERTRTQKLPNGGGSSKSGADNRRTSTTPAKVND